MSQSADPQSEYPQGKYPITETPILLRDDSEGIATLTLNRPQQYNALSSAMLAELQSALDDIAANDSLRVVIIGANGKA